MVDRLRTTLAKLITRLDIGPASLRARAWLWLAGGAVQFCEVYKSESPDGASTKSKERTMKKSVIIIGALALIAVGVVIGWTLSTGRPLPTPADPTLEIPPDSSHIFFPSPAPGPTEENPTLTLRCEVRDAITGERVTADAVFLGDAPGQGQVMHRDVAIFEITVPGKITSDHLFLSVVAKGYQTWNMGLRHNLNRSRILPFSIKLEPLPATPAPQAMRSE